MLQLALETTGKSGSLAVLDGENVLFKRRLGLQRRTASEIAVNLKSALQWCEDQSRTIEGISVAVGPGSFTGLRIAVTTAKTLAYALQLPVVSVGSLAAIAAVTATMDTDSKVLVGLNAYRRQVFAAEFLLSELQENHKIRLCNHRAAVWSRAEWDRRVAQAIENADCAVAGDPTIFSAPHENCLAARDEPDAVGVGRVAAKLIAAELAEAGTSTPPLEDSGAVLTDPFSLTVRYLKPSAAEEKAALR